MTPERKEARKILEAWMDKADARRKAATDTGERLVQAGRCDAFAQVLDNVDALLGQPDPELTGRPEDDRLVAERADEPAWVERAERAEEDLRVARELLSDLADEMRWSRESNQGYFDLSEAEARLRAVLSV